MRRTHVSPALVGQLLEARSVAVIGASEDTSRVGGRPIHFLKEHGFAGRIVPVNPKRATVQGLPAVPEITAAEGDIDLAIVAVRSDLVEPSVEACLEKGVRGIVVFSSGLGETGPEGKATEGRISRRARDAGVALLGPNCLGALDVHAGLIATFSSALLTGLPQPGSAAIVSQSGAVGMHVMAACRDRGIGISKWLSTGNEAALGVADCIAYLADDDATDVIAVYLEGVRDGTPFRQALRHAAAVGKPVVLLQSGRSSAGAAAAASHSGALVGSTGAFEAVCAEAGVRRVDSVSELVDLTYLHQKAPSPVPSGTPDSVGVFTLSGGFGAIMADTASHFGLELPETPPELQEQLAPLLPGGYLRNPIDVTGAVVNDPSLMSRALEVVLDSKAFSVVLHCMAHIGLDLALLQRFTDLLWPVVERDDGVVHIVSGLMSDDSTALMEAHGMLVIPDPSEAVRAAAALVDHRRARASAPPPPLTPSQPRAYDLGGGPWNEAEARGFLRTIGIDVPSETVVATPEAAVEAASSIGFPVALKVVSAQLPHKSDVGGVRLGLAGEAAVEEAFGSIMAAGTTALGQPPDGVLVTPMVSGSGVETILGLHRDPVFGPVVVFGLGGVFVEVFDAVTLRLPVLDRARALDMIHATRGVELLLGARGRGRCDLETLADAIVALSEAAPGIDGDWESIEINPLLVLEEGRGVVPLDASITQSPAGAGDGDSGEEVGQ